MNINFFMGREHDDFDQLGPGAAEEEDLFLGPRQPMRKRARRTTSPNPHRGMMSGSFVKMVSYQEMLYQTDKAVLLKMRGKEIWFPRTTCPYIDSENKRVVVYKDFLKMKLKEARLEND